MPLTSSHCCRDCACDVLSLAVAVPMSLSPCRQRVRQVLHRGGRDGVLEEPQRPLLRRPPDRGRVFPRDGVQGGTVRDAACCALCPEL